MEITGMQDGNFLHRVSTDHRHCTFLYDPVNRHLEIFHEGKLWEILERNRQQILKILHTKRPDTFFPGFRLTFSVTDNKDPELFNDLNSIIILDRRGETDRISFARTSESGIHEIFTDGCFLQSTGQSGLAAVLKYPDGRYAMLSLSSDAGNNCLAELQAVILGLENLRDVQRLRLISDSRYVRKGLTEWMFNWKLNNWRTANNEPARHADEWKKLERLTRGKYIEVAWVKGHSGHFENTMCDLYARDAAQSMGLKK
ncbi:MAG: ribonuclease H [Bacteroidales bacterium]